ncbi:MAG: hypothetical protein JWO62_3305 [Acidimicrobiaceae bacterium]|jgi:uncharacterized protein (DUF1501 family)|nr:hypothetical protein [Acidimicrobiaceae bacterium]
MANPMNRRQFLAGAIGVGVAGALPRPMSRLSLRPRAEAVGPASAADTTAHVVPGIPRTLVLLTLYGGNDGLNTVVPYEDSTYLSKRSNIVMKPDAVLPIGDGLGLNPALVNFKSMWDARQLAIVRGVGYPDPNLSHFQSMDIWQTASTVGDVATGWLGRWLDRTAADPLRACSVGAQVLPAMAGTVRKASAVQDSTYAGSQLPYADPEFLAVYRELQRPRAGVGFFEAAVASSGAEMLRTSKEFAQAIAHEPAPTFPRGVYGGDVGTQLGVVSQLIRAGLPTQAYSVTQGGYDTHSGEVGTQSELLKQLDASIAAFFTSLAGHPRGTQTTVVIYTEFGRRVDSNASGGTDHGTANNVYVLGPAVRGGFYGEQPSLTRLDPNGNLVHNVDFRSVYATALEHILGVDAKPFLGRRYPVLGFV